MSQVRKAGAVSSALVLLMVLGLLLSSVPGAAAQRGGGTPLPPTTYETLCVSVHNGLLRAITSGTCQGHEITVDVSEDRPLTLCVNEFTKVARAVDGSPDCVAHEDGVEVTGFADFEICVSPFTGVVRVPAPAPCQASEITGILPGILVANEYQSLPNVGLDVLAESGLLANDVPGTEVVSAGPTSQQGGDVSIAADGSFTYAPPAGFTGEDAFVYTVSFGDDEVERTAEITVEGPVIWFVNNDVAADGDGRLGTPFNALASVNDDGADPDAPGDIIFLFTGGDNYAGGLVLEDGQMLIGHCLDLVATANITVPPFSAELPELPATGTPCAPFLENVAGSGNALDLAPDTFVGGLSVVFGDHGVSGTSFSGDVEIREVDVLQAAGNAINLVDIDGTVTVRDSILDGRDGSDGLNGEDGGQGIYAENLTLLNVDGGEVSGGSGGDATAGDGTGGDGGDAINLVATTATISQTVVTGGDGGNNLAEGSAASGGDGIFAANGASVTFNGGATTGGDGGSGNAGGNGGNGMFVDDDSDAVVVGTGLSGGHGGSGQDSLGGSGGYGIIARSAGPVSVQGAVLTGGNGGGTLGSIAGSGGEGLGAFESDQVTITTSQLTGGAGAAASLEEGLDGSGGSGALARSTSISVQDSVLLGAVGGSTDLSDGNGLSVVEFDFGTFFADVRNNVLQGARDAESLVVGAFGPTTCLNAVGNSDATGDGPVVNGFVLRTRVDGPTLSITQHSLDELSADNNDVSIETTGQIGLGCTG